MTSDSVAVIAAFCGLGGALFGSIVTAMATVRTTKHLQEGENIRLQALLEAENARARGQFQHEINQRQADRLRKLFEPYIATHLAIQRYIEVFKVPGTDLAYLKERGEIVTQSAETATKNFAAVEIDPNCQDLKVAIREAIEVGTKLIMYMASPDFNMFLHHEEFAMREREYEEVSKNALGAMHDRLRRLDSAVEFEMKNLEHEH
jgi:hypothetical protein